MGRVAVERESGVHRQCVALLPPEAKLQTLGVTDKELLVWPTMSGTTSCRGQSRCLAC